jgi:hypothetical protein
MLTILGFGATPGVGVGPGDPGVIPGVIPGMGPGVGPGVVGVDAGEFVGVVVGPGVGIGGDAGKGNAAGPGVTRDVWANVANEGGATLLKPILFNKV